MNTQSLLPTLLLILFIGLKLCNVIAWSWLWVLSPFWIPIAVFVVFLAVCGLVYLGLATKEYFTKPNPKDTK